MADGMIYVPVNGEMVENSMALASSGGSSGSSYWLHWDNVNGFTSKGWFWDDLNNPLSKKWAEIFNNAGCGKSHTNDEAGFRDHMNSCNPENLNNLLADWDPIQKFLFVNEHLGELGLVDNSGCIDVND